MKLLVLLGLLLTFSSPCVAYSVNIMCGASLPQLPTPRHHQLVVKPALATIVAYNSKLNTDKADYQQGGKTQILSSHEVQWWRFSKFNEFIQQVYMTGGQWIFSGLIIMSIPFYYTTFIKK